MGAAAAPPVGGVSAPALAAPARAAATSVLVVRLGLFGRLVDFLAATVFRTDFLPFYAFVTALCGGAKIFAWSFAVGSVFAMIETFFTVRAVRRMSP